MKTKILNIAIVTLFAGMLFSCSDWTKPEPNSYYESHSDEYYANLKAYKKSDHSVSFGWFGNWTGKGASMVNCLMGLPDSVDFVSMWGNWHSLTPEKWADKTKAKELKGTRVMICFIIDNIGAQTTPDSVRKSWEEHGFENEQAAVNAFWGFDASDDAKVDASIRKYVSSIVDTIVKYDWDGFDFDLEPTYGHGGNLASYPERLGIFINEMAKYCGNTSGTDRILAVDGEPYSVPKEEAHKIDYYIVQAYSWNSGRYGLGHAGYDNRLAEIITAFDGAMSPEEVTRRTIICEDFEYSGYASNGGRADVVTRDGRRVPSLRCMAEWEPTTGVRKGGVGTYHMEYDYPNKPEYKYLRQAIGIMNPVVK